MDSYAINIKLNYNNDNILSYRVEWDYETYYRKIQKEIKVKEKGKLM